jgi:plastocyanin
MLATACGGAATSTPITSQPPTLTARVDATPDITFNPGTANVVPGGTVTFAFGTVAHNVFFDAAAGAPADIPGTNTGTSVTRTFATAGTYPYSCHIHPGMRGVVVVGTDNVTPSTGGGYP